jgi:hypothetical protein
MAAHLEYKTPIIVEVPNFSPNRNVYKFSVKTENAVVDPQANMILNAKLSDFGFEKVMHPYLAFQEIDQFLSTHLNCQTKEMVQIKDIDQIAKKGFDKWSFRTMPTKTKKVFK